MKTITKISFLVTLVLGLMTGACAQRSTGDGGDDTMNPDGGTDLTVDPPAESGTWPCRSGVDAEGTTYMEFRPGYLNSGTVETAYIVGQADGEGIYGYFHGAYVQEGKDTGSSWYRLPLTGPKGSTGVLTYASKVDLTGTDSSAWAQYGGSLSAEAAGPFRWNSSGSSYACKFEIGDDGRPAIPRGDTASN